MSKTFKQAMSFATLEELVTDLGSIGVPLKLRYEQDQQRFRADIGDAVVFASTFEGLVSEILRAINAKDITNDGQILHDIIVA